MADLSHGGVGTGQLDSGLELSFLMSRSCEFRSETENHEFRGSSTKLDCQPKFSIKFPQSTMVWEHPKEECQQLQLDLCVFCEQMSLPWPSGCELRLSLERSRALILVKDWAPP